MHDIIELFDADPPRVPDIDHLEQFRDPHSPRFTMYLFSYEIPRFAAQAILEFSPYRTERLPRRDQRARLANFEII